VKLPRLPPSSRGTPPLRMVGKPLRRVDALSKAVGATVYAGDYSMPNMLHAKVFRSTEPSARIKWLDVGRARALEGVVCVLTASDLLNARLGHRHAGPDGPIAAFGIGCARPGL